MTDPRAPLARLKRRLERLEPPRPSGAGLFTLGCAPVDARLGGGLAHGAIHELCPSAPGDQWAASGFALMLALRASGSKPVLWVREDRSERMHGMLYGSGLAALGAAPDRILIIHAPDTVSALRTGADIVETSGLGAVVIEPFGAAKALDLTASRKLLLAATRSGAAAFILRDRSSSLASAASTRWAVAAAPSTLLPGDAPGHTVFRLELLRHRGGVAPFETLLEWTRDEQIFREPAALLRDFLSPAQRRQMAA